jgi:Right handed beta helix region
MQRAIITIFIGLLGTVSAFAESLIQVTNATQLQSAFTTISDGGVIEVANGTYPSPAGGFSIINPNKSFTVRAAVGATPVLDGGDTRLVFRYMSTSAGVEGFVTFEGLTFRNGFSDTPARAGGFTQERGKAVFVDCVVEQNAGTLNGSGGYWSFNNALSWWIDSRFEANTTLAFGAGARVDSNSKTWIHRTTFLNNRNNLPGHVSSAVAGGIHFFDSDGFITNSRFEGNESSFAGAGLYAIGTFVAPFNQYSTNLVVANTTFINNKLLHAPGNPPPTPGEGGGIHIENEVNLRLYNSRLIKNTAPIGGGLSMYRSTAVIEGSVFRGNQAIDTSASSGFGGAIKASSDDVVAGTDFPSSSLTVRDSLFQGRFEDVTTVANNAGGIFVGGDSNRAYEEGDIPAARAPVVLERVSFYDLDVNFAAGGSSGGALSLALVNLTANDIQVVGSDALGLNTGGGGMFIFQNSIASITNSTFADNSATARGGAVWVKGSDLTLTNNQFYTNELPSTGDLLGAALFTEPQPTFGILPATAVTGTVSGNTFSVDRGLAICDSDNQAQPINDVRYNDNDFFPSAQSNTNHPTGSGTAMYGHAIGAFTKHSPTSLNSFVVTRTSGPSTDKSSVNNTALGSEPLTANLLATPPEVLSQVAVGDVGGTTPVYLTYVAGGAAATLDSNPVAGPFGLLVSGIGSHTLVVGARNEVEMIDAGAAPDVSFEASPIAIDVGQTSSLSWALADGTFIDLALDHGLNSSSATSGTVVVMPPCTTTYRLCLVTKEGGQVAEATVFVGEFPGMIFQDGFETGNTSEWSSATP